MANQNDQLESEIQAAFKKHHQNKPTVKKKERTALEKTTLVMAWVMVIIMVGSIIYSAVSALG